MGWWNHVQCIWCTYVYPMEVVLCCVVRCCVSECRWVSRKGADCAKGVRYTYNECKMLSCVWLHCGHLLSILCLALVLCPPPGYPVLLTDYSFLEWRVWKDHHRDVVDPGGWWTGVPHVGTCEGHLCSPCYIYDLWVRWTGPPSDLFIFVTCFVKLALHKKFTFTWLVNK